MQVSGCLLSGVPCGEGIRWLETSHWLLAVGQVCLCGKFKLETLFSFLSSIIASLHLKVVCFLILIHQGWKKYLCFSLCPGGSGMLVQGNVLQGFTQVFELPSTWSLLRGIHLHFFDDCLVIAPSLTIWFITATNFFGFVMSLALWSKSDFRPK